nr:MAG TPA: hypothetical protein [Caudoviricetes sp.]
MKTRCVSLFQLVYLIHSCTSESINCHIINAPSFE